MVENTAPRNSMKMKLTIAIATRTPPLVERVAYSRNSGGMLFIVSSKTLDDALLQRGHEQIDRNRHDEVHEGADDAGEQADHRAIAGHDRRGLALLQQVRGHHTAADDPQAAAQVADRDQGQRRQHADDQSADQCRLGQGRFHSRVNG